MTVSANWAFLSRILTAVFVPAALVVSGCGPTGTASRPGQVVVRDAEFKPGRATAYEDSTTSGAVSGINIEAQDIGSMIDRMARDLLAQPLPPTGNGDRPRVIVDSRYFTNESATIINKNILTDRLRVLVTRAAAGRLVTVGRHYADMVENERRLKRDGVVGQGTSHASAPFGGDYRLGGVITSHDAVDPATGFVSRFHQIVFELVALETGEIVWSGIYDFKKSGQDDIVYR